MRPEFYHKTTLADEAEGCLGSTKYVQQFAIWQWAVNSANLEKCRLCLALPHEGNDAEGKNPFSFIQQVEMLHFVQSTGLSHA